MSSDRQAGSVIYCKRCFDRRALFMGEPPRLCACPDCNADGRHRIEMNDFPVRNPVERTSEEIEAMAFWYWLKTYCPTVHEAWVKAWKLSTEPSSKPVQQPHRFKASLRRQPGICDECGENFEAGNHHA